MMRKYTYAALIVAGFACGRRTDPPVTQLSAATSAAASVAPDDTDPTAAKLAHEAKEHREAPVTSASASASASAAPSEVVDVPADSPPSPPETRPWQAAGVLVLTLEGGQAGQNSAQNSAASLRWYLSRHKASGWSNHVEAIHIYESLWAARVSPVNEEEALRLCKFLLAPMSTEVAWIYMDPGRRACRFTATPKITTKTPYKILAGPPASTD